MKRIKKLKNKKKAHHHHDVGRPKHVSRPDPLNMSLDQICPKIEEISRNFKFENFEEIVHKICKIFDKWRIVFDNNIKVG